MASWFGRRASSVEPANAAAAAGHPELFISYDDSHNWAVEAKAQRILRSIKGPICVIAVCGRARQGKSFMLNQILGRMSGNDKFDGFKVSPTQSSCTRGIWMWSNPLQIPGPDGRKINVILMDCEGVDAVDQGSQTSAQIFALAMLFSGIFIYNQVGAIDAIAIERLALVCEFAKRIKDKSANKPSTGAGSSSGFGAAAAAGQVDFSPSFIWLLRDFQLRLEADNKSISPAEYLEEALLPIKGNEADIANKNQMRQTIKTVFPDRDVAVMVRPALQESDLQQLDKLAYSNLRPEFRRDMEAFMAVLKGKTRPMAVGGTLISGPLMAGLAEAYVEAVNKGAVPQLVTAWQGVSKNETEKAFKQAEEQYISAFQVAGINDDAVLYDKYLSCMEGALATFKALAMGEPELTQEYEDKLRKGCEERYAEAKRKLAASGERQATEMLAAEGAKLRGIMEGPGASVEAVESELRRFLDEYDLKVPSGSFKYKKAAEFLMNTIILGIKGIVKGLVTAHDAAEARATAAEASVTQLRAEVTRLTEAESRATSTRSELLAAKQEAAHLKGQVDAKERHAADLDAELRSLRQQATATAAAQAKQQQELDVSRAEVARLQGQLGAAGRLQGELDSLRTRLAEAATREATLQADKAAAEQEAQRSAAQLATAQQSVERLQQQVSAGGGELSALRGRVEQLDRELAEARAAAEGAQVADSRVRGELEEERKKVTAKIKEVADLTADLVKERTAHDALKEEVKGLRTAAAAGAASTPADTPAGGRAGKRRRTEAAAAADDDEMHDAEPAPEETPAAAGGTPVAVNKDIVPKDMKIADLKTWVTDNRLEDDEFFKMMQSSKTKKADWVAFVEKKLKEAA